MRDLKGYGLWTKMKAIYPFVGGTATTHKWNLKDPRDSDAAFRLTFSGGWTHSANGADPNGTTGYADTFFTPNSSALLNSSHISYYSRENATATEVEIGVQDQFAGRLFIEINTAGTTYTSVNTTQPNDFASYADADAKAYYMAIRNDNANHISWRNAIKKVTKAQASTSLSIYKIYIGAYNNVGSALYYSTKQCAFATIGDGLTDTDATNLYNAVDRYQKFLGRAV